MSISIWHNLVTQMRNHQESTDKYRIAVLGIGNELNGDDAVGVIVANRLIRSILEDSQANTIDEHLIIPVGQMPENYTGKLRTFHPNLVILVDAAQMNAAPGTVECLKWQDTIGMSASTHSIPVSLLSRYLSFELGCDVCLIGIQPGSNEFGEGLSLHVAQAAEVVVRGLRELLFQH